jgi:hypothetical protein
LHHAGFDRRFLNVPKVSHGQEEAVNWLCPFTHLPIYHLLIYWFSSAIFNI